MLGGNHDVDGYELFSSLFSLEMQKTTNLYVKDRTLKIHDPGGTWSPIQFSNTPLEKILRTPLVLGMLDPNPKAYFPPLINF